MSKAARPVRSRGKWRIRWLDHTGARQSAVFDSEREAPQELDARRVEVEPIRRGLRKRSRPQQTFGSLCDHWLATRALEKRPRGVAG